MEATAKKKNELPDEDDTVYTPPVKQYQQQQQPPQPSQESYDSHMDYRPSAANAVIAKNKVPPSSNQGKSCVFILTLINVSHK